MCGLYFANKRKCVILVMFSWTIWTLSWKQFIIYWWWAWWRHWFL